MLDTVSKLSELNNEKYPFGGITDVLNESKEEILGTLQTFDYEVVHAAWGDSAEDMMDTAEAYAYECLGVSEDEEIDEETLEEFLNEAVCSIMGTTELYSYNGEKMEYKGEKFNI